MVAVLSLAGFVMMLLGLVLFSAAEEMGASVLGVFAQMLFVGGLFLFLGSLIYGIAYAVLFP